MNGFDRDVVSYWIDITEYDLETAEAMLVTKRFLYVGFMCHQAIKKYLKACYVHVLATYLRIPITCPVWRT
jgi:HEPN domain-containing protein